MNCCDHNFIEITQQTKLRVALVVSSESSSVDIAQIHGLDMSSRVVSSRAKWNLGFTELQTAGVGLFTSYRPGLGCDACLGQE